MTYGTIKIEKGSGGFGGPLVVTPKPGKDKILYITGGGAEPEIVEKIVKLTGATAVNGFKTSVPDEEIFLAIIDCGGTLRCGIYPQKRIPTVNIMPVGPSGPLAKFIKEDIYVSAVGLDQISSAEGSEEVVVEKTQEEPKREFKYSADKKVSQSLAENTKSSVIQKIGMGAGKVVHT